MSTHERYGESYRYNMTMFGIMVLWLIIMLGYPASGDITFRDSLRDSVAGTFLLVGLMNLPDKRILSLISILGFAVTSRIGTDENLFDNWLITISLIGLLVHVVKLGGILKDKREENNTDGFGETRLERLSNTIEYKFKMQEPPVVFRIITYCFMLSSFFIVANMYRSMGTSVNGIDISIINIFGSMVLIFAVLMEVVDVHDCEMLWLIYLITGMTMLIQYGSIEISISTMNKIIEQFIYIIAIPVGIKANRIREYPDEIYYI